jgi:hypothetical protein
MIEKLVLHAYVLDERQYKHCLFPAFAGLEAAHYIRVAFPETHERCFIQAAQLPRYLYQGLFHVDNPPLLLQVRSISECGPAANGQFAQRRASCYVPRFSGTHGQPRPGSVHHFSMS